MNYDFNVPLKNIDGSIRETETLSKILSEFIGMESKGNTVKLFGWMQELAKLKPLQLDEADRQDLEKMIIESERTFIYVKGQLLEILKK
jgi:hypothetical protein